MKKFKKILSFTLALALCLSIAIPAFAVDEEEMSPQASYIWMGVITGDGVYFRPEPALSSKPGGQLYKGDEMILDQLNVSGSDNNMTWVHGMVTTGENQHNKGFVEKSYVKIEYITIP